MIIGKWFIFLLLVPAVSSATEFDFYSRHGIGWHWYQDPKNREPEEQESSPEKTLSVLQAHINQLRTRAILEPSEENIYQYIQLQNGMAAFASYFSEQWQKVVYKFPELNYSLEHPVSQVARNQYYLRQQQEQEKLIKAFSKRFGLFFFYHSQCSYCQAFAPILQDFSLTYNLSLLPVSIDGERLPEFPNSTVDQGQSISFGIKQVPALFAVDFKSKKIITISYGLLTQEQLIQQLVKIMQDEIDE